MKILADEGVDGPIVRQLREDGHDVTYIQEFDAGISDDKVLEIANSENRILITRDKDFGELVFNMRLVHEGIILNRLAALSAESKAILVSNVIRDLGERLKGSFTVIRPGKVRIKKLN